MKKSEQILEPIIFDENVLVEFTDAVAIDKSLTVIVPNGYQAVVFIDEKVAFKINTCVGKKLIEYGKEYLNCKCKVAYVRTKMFPQMMWGFGNIQVNNERLEEAYRVGANGKYSVEIAEVGRFINCFDSQKNITLDVIREKTISIIKNLGTAVLGKFFANTDVSVFEFASLTVDLRNTMINAIKDEKIFIELGLKLRDLVVDSIYVNEEDLEIIRNRINNVELYQKVVDVQPKIDYVEELRQAKKEIEKEIIDKLNAKLENLQDILVSSVEEKMQDLFPLQDNAKEDYIKNVKLTAQYIIDNAENGDDFIPAVAMIYSNIEDNLINKFNLRHEGKTFVMDYQEYKAIAESAKIGNYYILKRKNRNSGALEIIPPKVIKTDETGKPKLVEMLPIVRFVKAGFNAELSQTAAGYWIVLNKIRHKSEENLQFLKKYFDGIDDEKKYLKLAYKFFKDNGLYTKE